MAVEATHVAQFAVASIYLGLAVWLLYLDFPRTINRVLSLLFFLRGATLGLNQLVQLDPSRGDYWHASRVYFFIATAFVILDFLIVYTWRRTSAVRRGGRQFLLGVAVVVEATYLVDHSLFSSMRGDAPIFGPLGVLTRLYLPFLALAALWFSWLARNTALSVQARFHAMVALGFSMAALAETAGLLGAVITNGWTAATTAAGPEAGAVASQILAIATVPLALASSGILVRLALTRGSLGQAAWCGALTAATLIPPILVRVLATSAEAHSYLFFSAVPRALAAALIAYALARQLLMGHDLFAMDLRAAASIRRGTVGGILVALFFVVSESAAQLLGEFAATQDLSPAIAQLIGIVGAGILLIFLHPLNRLGERLSTSALPHARSLNELGDSDRLRIYEEQVQLAWADGSITRKERLLLDKLREQLNLPVSKAVSAESRAVKQSSA